MAAQDKVTFKQDLTEPVKIRHYEGVVFTGDDCGNLIKVALFDSGTPYSGGGTVSATAVLADGTTFPLTQGSITGNMVSVPLEAGALVVSGLMGLYVKISGDGIICTVLNAIFTVQATDTGRVPTATVTTVNELVAAIRDAQDSIPADLTNLLAAVAPTFSTSTAYSAGAYVWHGGKLYRFTTAHPAGTWTGTDAVTVALGNDVADLKSAVDASSNMIGNGSYAFPLADAETYRKSIYSDGTWSVATGGNQTLSSILSVPNGAKKVTVVCAADATIIAFLKSFTGNEATGDAVDFASNYTSRIDVSANSTREFTLYGDEKYICVLRRATAGANKTPQSVTVYSDVLTGTDKTLSISGMAADAEKVGTLADGSYFPQKGNAAKGYTRYEPGKYVYSGTVGAGVNYQTNADYSTVIVPVDESEHYTCNRLRYLTLLDENLFTLQVSLQNVEEFDTISGTKFVAATFYNADNTIDNLIISAGDELDPSALKHDIPWLYHPPYGTQIEALKKSIYRRYPFGEQYKGNDQSKVLGTANSIKKGKFINFSCDFSTFGTLHIKLQTAGGTVENDFAITSTTVTRTVDGSTKAPVTHGLTIQNTVGVRIEFVPSGFKFSIISNGETFEQTYEYASAAVAPAYEVSGMTVSNVDFSWSCKDFANGIWLFGDSYFSYGTNRWIYYLIENGYGDHCLIDGYPGETSIGAIASLKSYISMSVPKFAVWCLGMNDGSDNGAPTTQWLSNAQEFLSVCKNNNITPILATVPTVPTINHDYKAAWVRESGYQYIDFAKAVGASSSGWFAGMLASDGVHPTVAGAMALYHRAMTDAPQLYNVI